MYYKILLIMTLLLTSVNALANDPPHGSAAEAAKALRVTNKYVGSWVPFPALALKTMDTLQPEQVQATKGRVLIVAYLASWCVPCQQIIPDLKKLAAKYQEKYTDLVFVFAHDTEPDARAFASYHKLEGKAYLGTAKALEDFHQPELPSIYVADRYGWLVYRKLNVKPGDLTELDTFLELHTSF